MKNYFYRSFFVIFFFPVWWKWRILKNCSNFPNGILRSKFVVNCSVLVLEWPEMFIGSTVADYSKRTCVNYRLGAPYSLSLGKIPKFASVIRRQRWFGTRTVRCILCLRMPLARFFFLILLAPVFIYLHIVRHTRGPSGIAVGECDACPLRKWGARSERKDVEGW